MVDKVIENNAASLETELEWFLKVVDARIKIHFGHECDFREIPEITPPEINANESYYGKLIAHYKLSFEERIIIILALIPNIKPQLLDIFLTVNKDSGRQVTEFGGLTDPQTGSFIPTIETALFIIAGEDLNKRFHLYHIFDAGHYFIKHNILKADGAAGSGLNFNTPLSLTPEYVDLITIGEARKPVFGINFPAKLISTKLEWEDLVLEQYTMEQVLEIQAWIEYGHIMLNQMGLGKKIKPGYRSFFYGPPGTGKTLTASLLGKITGLDVYRIDLSTVVSKYIGETEKNLEKIFQQAEYKNWILFFDEADALFGKRTNISNAHDRFANQEVSYLLQRVEDYPGVIIIASNMRSNIDEAFIRRFQSIIYFPMPRVGERIKLWTNAFSKKSVLDENINIREISSDYELSGGSIMNVVRYATLMSLKKDTTMIFKDDLYEGIRKEFQKEGMKL